MTPDVLGPFEKIGAEGVRVETVGGARLRLTADVDLTGFATGRFSQPAVGVRWSAANWADTIEFAGFAFTQFALPVTGGRSLDFDFQPAPDLRSTRAVSPLLARDGGDVVLLAPVDHPHEQVIAVTDDSLIWGWHGDLDEIPAGFSTTLGIYSAASMTDALARWRNDLTIVDRVALTAANPVSTHLSYWTDNGAAYWYRTEAGQSITESVADAVKALRDADVPVHAIELDSWFYPHATMRPIAEIGYPAEVPPTGMQQWSDRADAFPAGLDGDPMATVSRRLGDAPLVLHSRHIAPDSPYVTEPDEWWVDELAAQPRDPGFFRRWFDDAVRWGATCIEQDWMLMYWFGVRALRAVPGRAASWQAVLNDHAQATGVDLLWCMATPADLMLAAGLDRVVAVRTCDDYRFADDPAFLWTWFLTVNRLANTLGLPAFKDCFFSNPDVTSDDDAIDGDRHAEVEALLSALSGGPVGIGDRIGHTDRDVVMRTCDADGRLRRVDAALAVTDGCMFGGPARGDGLLWSTTTATDADGDVWTYVVAINTATESRVIADRHRLAGDRTVLDWRDGTERTTDVIEVELAARDWSLHVVAPVTDRSPSIVGDPGKYVVVEAAPPAVRR